MLLFYFVTNLLFKSQCTMSSHKIHKIDLKPSYIGTSYQLVVHEYTPSQQTQANKKLAYIQASLHADEIPGLLVNHHLIHMLNQATETGLIQNDIKIVSFANPLGLSQNHLGTHIGRFSTNSGINFNRDWPDLKNSIVSRLKENNKLRKDDRQFNVNYIRKLISNVIEEEHQAVKIDKVLKKELFKLSAVADIVIDLHCDCNAVMHMYTHDRLWPEMKDLASDLGSECVLLSPDSGGNCFDESCSSIWASVADAFPGYDVPMACQSVTVELRGEIDVSDDFALRDANSIYTFLTRRGFIAPPSSSLMPPLTPPVRDAAPLTGVDMVEAPAHGVIVFKIAVGSMVTAGQLIAEIVNIEDPSAPRIQLTSKTDGILFGTCLRKLVSAGQIVFKVSGAQPLDWRKGNLLTA